MRDLDNLNTVLDLIDLIQQTVEQHNETTFAASIDALHAVTYRLGMIGEHCKRLPDELKTRHTDVPWREMAALRNIVVHRYDSLSPAIVWTTATSELAAVETMAITELDRLAHDLDLDDRGL